MRAVILAAGEGLRMRPLTDKIPKPLLKVHGKSLIVWHIEKLAYLGFSEIVINIDYLGDKIIEALSDGSAWGVSITYSDERQSGALESAGGIIKALPFMGKDTFLVVNSDVWCDYEFDFNFDLKDDLAHLILVPNPQHNPEGDFGLSKERVTNDSNKKSTFSGIGYYSPKLFENIEMQKTPLAPILREAANNKRVGGSLYLGEWHDIGTPQRLKDIQN